MKVLLISPLPPPAGGDSTWAQKYLEYCEELNCPVNIVNTSVIGKRANNVEGVKSISEEIKRSFKIWWNVYKSITTRKYDVVHMNTNCSPKGIIRDFISSLILAKYKIPIILHCHCDVEDQINNSRIGLWFLKKTVKNSHTVIVLNKKSKIYVDSKNNIDSKIVANFIDIKFIRHDRKMISNNITKALFVGHVTKTKGIEEIISVSHKFPDIEFTIVGPITEEFINRNYPANIVFLGAVQLENVRDLLDSTDVFLFPSYTEGFAVALLEAMARGLPIIASDVGANRDMIENIGGIIVRPKNVNDIVDAITRIDNTQVRKEMSKWNVEKVKTFYIINKVMDELQKIYQEAKK